MLDSKVGKLQHEIAFLTIKEDMLGSSLMTGGFLMHVPASGLTLTGMRVGSDDSS